VEAIRRVRCHREESCETQSRLEKECSDEGSGDRGAQIYELGAACADIRLKRPGQGENFEVKSLKARAITAEKQGIVAKNQVAALEE